MYHFDLWNFMGTTFTVFLTKSVPTNSSNMYNIFYVVRKINSDDPYYMNGIIIILFYNIYIISIYYNKHSTCIEFITFIYNFVNVLVQ